MDFNHILTDFCVNKAVQLSLYKTVVAKYIGLYVIPFSFLPRNWTTSLTSWKMSP